MRFGIVPALVIGGQLTGCVSHSSSSDYATVRTLAQERARLELPTSPSNPDQQDADEDVRALMRRPLTLESAERIALLNNRDLRAELQGLGIARGQLVQASLFPNPEFEVAMRVPQQSGAPLEWDLGAGIDLTALILRGARAAVADAELDAARVRAASTVLDLGLRVRLAYYAMLASGQRLEIAQTALAAFAASYETARALQAAGNVTELDVATEHSAYEAARIVASEVEADLLDDRERLNVLLGFHGRETDWHVTQRLPDVSDDLPEAKSLESRAIESSLELAGTRSTLTALSRRVGLAKNAGWLPDLNVGVSAERRDGVWEVGPALRGTLPVWGREQGAVLTSQARFDQLRERYVATAIEIRAAVRAARNRATSAHERARHYRDTVLPLREQVVHETLLQYNAMQVGVFQLLQARREQLESANKYIDTLEEYWRTRAELDQLLAGRLSGAIGPMGRSDSRSSMGQSSSNAQATVDDASH